MRVPLAAFAAGLLTAAASLAAPATFNKDVLPILQQNCQECHRPGEVAPFSLMTYKDARPWAKAVKAAVAARKMPPWFADPGFRHYANERKLSDEQIATISNWVDGGALEGDAKDAPAPISFPSGWAIKPDIEVSMPKAFNLPAKGTINYKFILVKANFPEDIWVESAEMRPGNPKVVHHGKVWVRPPGSHWMEKAVPGEAYEQETQFDIMGMNLAAEGNDMLGKFNPGLGAQVFNVEGSAKFIPKGSDLVFEVHYTANGEPTSDVSKLGIVLAKYKPVSRYMLHTGPTAGNLVIPPGDANAEVVSELTTTAPAKLAYVQPHMHLRGKDFELRLYYPTGENETVYRGKWDFEWQQGFTFSEPINMPVGTRIVGISHFDNSPNNKWNPDPAKEVRWGFQNWEEMSNAFIGIVFDNKIPAETVLRRTGPSLLRPVPGQAGPTLSTVASAKR